MEYSSLESTVVNVSDFCFGTWRFGQELDGKIEIGREQAYNLLDKAWDHGINFIDTANFYGEGKSEHWIGDWLAEHDREEFVIASKVFWTRNSPVSENLSRKTIRAEINGTLDRLDTDYIDIYYIHRWDDEIPITETLSALTDLVREWKVHYLGGSSMAAW